MLSLRNPSRTAEWIESGGRRYWVEMDRERTLIMAEVEVAAHDKRKTLRAVRHPVTLARLQAIVRPEAKCPTCGGTT